MSRLCPALIHRAVALAIVVYSCGSTFGCGQDDGDGKAPVDAGLDVDGKAPLDAGLDVDATDAARVCLPSGADCNGPQGSPAKCCSFRCSGLVGSVTCQ